MNSISIGYAEAPSTYSPLSYEAKNRKFFANIYEPLVTFDGTFNTDSALAVSWGRLDDTTWDFHLRQNVYFHDGKTFSAADTVYSINLARGATSELHPLLSTISSVEQTADDRITIKTTAPDPLLLNRLTYVYMVPNGTTDFVLPIGTGPYRVHEFAQDDLVLERFNDYWGPLAYFPEVHLKTVADPVERVKDLENNSLQALANVPPQSAEELKAQGLTMTEFPSLEVTYLVLNQDHVFKDPNLRAAVNVALATDYADRLGGGYLMGTSQFAATGIEGYSKTAPQREQNLTIAKDFRSKVEGPVAVILDIPQGVESLGEAIAFDLAAIDIQVTVNVLSPADLQSKIVEDSSDFYFFGWKYDLADNEDFFEAVAHSKVGDYGQFNGAGYADATLDSLIEKASRELVLTERRLLITQIEDQLLEDKVIVPLFESKTLYAFHAPLLWNSRLDGQLWATDLSENVVK
jgi:peptide/nickel transport system substrate-binding protein